MLIAHVNFILIASTSRCWCDISCLKTLNGVRQDPIVFSVLDVFPFNFLEVTCSHSEFMSLITHLLFIFVSHITDLFLQIDFLLVTCGIRILSMIGAWLIIFSTSIRSKTSSHGSNILDDVKWPLTGYWSLKLLPLLQRVSECSLQSILISIPLLLEMINLQRHLIKCIIPLLHLSLINLMLVCHLLIHLLDHVILFSLVFLQFTNFIS